MAFIFELDLLIIKVDMHAKNEDAALGQSRVNMMLTDTQAPLKPLSPKLMVSNWIDSSCI